MHPYKAYPRQEIVKDRITIRQISCQNCGKNLAGSLYGGVKQLGLRKGATPWTRRVHGE